MFGVQNPSLGLLRVFAPERFEVQAQVPAVAWVVSTQSLAWRSLLWDAAAGKKAGRLGLAKSQGRCPSVPIGHPLLSLPLSDEQKVEAVTAAALESSVHAVEHLPYARHVGSVGAAPRNAILRVEYHEVATACTSIRDAWP